VVSGRSKQGGRARAVRAASERGGRRGGARVRRVSGGKTCGVRMVRRAQRRCPPTGDGACVLVTGRIFLVNIGAQQFVPPRGSLCRPARRPPRRPVHPSSHPAAATLPPRPPRVRPPPPVGPSSLRLAAAARLPPLLSPVGRGAPLSRRPYPIMG